MSKKPKTHKILKALPKLSKFRPVIFFVWGIILGLIVLVSAAIYAYEQKYQNRAFAGVKIQNFNATGLTQAEIESYWAEKNISFQNLRFTLKFEDKIATLSARDLQIGYDAPLAAHQAISIGRSGNLLADNFQKLHALIFGIELKPLFFWNRELLSETLNYLSQQINIEPENALFEFKDGKVTAFKVSKDGRMLDTNVFMDQFTDRLQVISTANRFEPDIVFNLPVITVKPTIATEDINGYGITELIGVGESSFRGSIPGRVHNIALAASRINGILIAPGEIFSFNQALGDISAATGYKQAYVIKQGRTVLDDGGGVCQVSTTFFRAALNSGLPIKERHAHSYRVSYYEQDGVKPGFDATVYAPTYDLKVENNTGNYILIQAKTDTINYKLTFEFYGKKDGRTVEISPVHLWDALPSPPELRQDDPTLPMGVIKQVDWAAPGIKAAFDYKVSRGDEILTEQTFYSNFIPWQAVYLVGTGPAQ